MLEVDPRPEGYVECECGEKMTVVDLRDGPRDGMEATIDRGGLVEGLHRRLKRHVGEGEK